MPYLKTFSQFINEEGGGAGGVGGGSGAAPTNVVGGIAGARPGDLPPVSRKKQKKIQRRGAESEKELSTSLRRTIGTVSV